MGLPCEELEEEKEEYNRTISKAVVELVKQAREEDRVVCGILPCVNLMERSPESVMLCFLWQLSSAVDADTKVPLLLIYAFCHDNSIDLLQVHGQDQMAQLSSMCLTQQPAKCRSDVFSPVPSKIENDGGSVGCIMIKYPKHDTSHEDDMVIDYIRDKMQNRADPSIDLLDLTAGDMKEQFGVKLKVKKGKKQVQISPEVASILSM